MNTHQGRVNPDSPDDDKTESSTQGTFREVFQAELRQIKQRRHNLGIQTTDPDDEYSLPEFKLKKQPSDFFKYIESEFIQEEKQDNKNNRWKSEQVEAGFERGLIGLALSGGGIRSSTFNLGVLQAVHRLGLFPYIDYLSTVSGGGYIGTYLTTLLSSGSDKNDDKAPPVETNSKNGENFPIDRFPLSHQIGQEENQKFRHLRNYAKFLAPEGKTELLSIPIILIRGFVVNCLFLLPFIMVIALIIRGHMNQDGYYDYAEYLTNIYTGYFPGLKGIIPILHYFPITITGLAILLLCFALFPLMHWMYYKINKNLTEKEVKTNNKSLKFLQSLLIICIVFFFIELQPYLLNNVRNLEVWLGALLSGSIITIPFANKILNHLSKLVSLLGASLYGLLGLLVAWAIFLWIIKETGQINTFSFPSGQSFNFQNLGLWSLIILVLSFYSWLFVDVNTTSIHRYYRDHLVKAFVAQKNTDGESTRKTYDVPKLSALNLSHSPYPLINVTVNINRFENQYKNGRGAGFFFFSPEYCGGVRTRYISTKTLEEIAFDLDVGTAMAISGAAISPNMGRLTNRLLAFILAILNVRLNYWLPNPFKIITQIEETQEAEIKEPITAGTGAVKAGAIMPLMEKQGISAFVPQTAKKAWQPVNNFDLKRNRVGPIYLIREMLGLLDTRCRYINLSDGGHIENLGIYELLRRQCRLIIVGDGECDKNLTFEGLAEVMRLARIDFGFNIVMDGLDEIRSGDQQYAVGTIYYSKYRTGKLIYLKSNLGGDYNLEASLDPDLYRSSADRDDDQLFDNNAYIAHYRKTHPDFPQESTADQFFDETQFECYRALGYEVACSALIAPRMSNFEQEEEQQ